MDRLRQASHACALAMGLAGALPATSASAQDQSELIEIFAGEWFVFDREVSRAARPCVVTLNSAANPNQLTAETGNCRKPLGDVTTWSIVDGQIVLSASENLTVVTFGGTPQRLTGDLAETSAGIVMERASGDGSSAALAAALRNYKCYFRGFTDTCIEPADIEAPIFADGIAELDVLVNLNARLQPRRDAPVLGVVQGGTTLVINDCLTASDGIWCRAAFGDQQGWIAKTAVRQETWPIVTFVNAAQPQE